MKIVKLDFRLQKIMDASRESLWLVRSLTPCHTFFENLGKPVSYSLPV